MLTRRALLTLSAGSAAGLLFSNACGRRRGNAGFRGYAFVANEEGQASAAVDLEALAVARSIPLGGSRSSVGLVDLASRKLGNPAGMGDFGAVRFLADARTVIAADRGERRLSFYDVASSQLITHLPLAVRPDNLCFNADGGQLFVTGEGM